MNNLTRLFKALYVIYGVREAPVLVKVGLPLITLDALIQHFLARNDSNDLYIYHNEFQYIPMLSVSINWSAYQLQQAACEAGCITAQT